MTTCTHEDAPMNRELMGSPYYMAPEILLQKTSSKPVDIWAVGVVLFECLTGHVPFQGFDFEELRANIIKKEPEYPDYLSTEMKTLIKGMLVKDPKKRMTAHDCLMHSFINKNLT